MIPPAGNWYCKPIFGSQPSVNKTERGNGLVKGRMFSPSEGLASKAWIMMLGWFLSKARPLAVVNLMVQGMCGFRGGLGACLSLTCWLCSVPVAVDRAAGQGSSHPDGSCEVSPLDF